MARRHNRNHTIHERTTVNTAVCRRPTHNIQHKNNLTKAAHKLNQIKEYGLTITVKKTKSMAFNGEDSIWSKILINNAIIEKVITFNCLGNLISYGKNQYR
jgi:hypothetical protein